jgi:imidazolonepropionase
VEIDAASIDHLERATKEDAKLLANSNTVAVLLPGATYFLGKKKFANGQMLADSGCKVAIATDFNPGTCNSENLPLMLNMACLYNHVSPREALLGATRYAACALRADANIGSIAPGKLADILVLDTSDWREFIYHFGFLHTYLVFKRGKLVWNSTPKIPKLHSL